VRGARDLLSVALQYGNAFGQGFQAAALKPADFFENDDVLYLMEDMATGEIRLSILWEWLHKEAAFNEGDDETGVEAGDTLTGELFARLLAEAPRLAKQLDVDSGWERAVETVLGHYLEAVCIEGIDDLADVLGDLGQGSLSVIDTATSMTAAAGDATLLVNRVRSAVSVDGLLSGVHAAESLQEALRLRANLAPHESVVTRDGIWIGRNWLRIARDQDEGVGILEREKEINLLDSKLKEELTLISDLEQVLEAGRGELQQAEASREELQVEANVAHRQFSDARAQLDGRRTRLEQINNRVAALGKEGAEIGAQQADDNRTAEEARGRLHEALATLDTLADEREQRWGERDRLRRVLDEARAQAQRDRDEAHGLELKYQSLHTEQETTTQNLERMRGQQGHLQQRRDDLRESLAGGEAPLQALDEELAIKLQMRLEVEAELSDKRRRVEALDHQLREQEQQRHRQEQLSQELREQVGQQKLAWQEIKVRGETLLEQIADMGPDAMETFTPASLGGDADLAEAKRRIGDRVFPGVGHRPGTGSRPRRFGLRGRRTKPDPADDARSGVRARSPEQRVPIRQRSGPRR